MEMRIVRSNNTRLLHLKPKQEIHSPDSSSKLLRQKEELKCLPYHESLHNQDRLCRYKSDPFSKQAARLDGPELTQL